MCGLTSGDAHSSYINAFMKYSMEIIVLKNSIRKRWKELESNVGRYHKQECKP